VENGPLHAAVLTTKRRKTIMTMINNHKSQRKSAFSVHADSKNNEAFLINKIRTASIPLQ